jgi:hypothetical protein
MAWHLDPGDTIVRRELHDRYGGGRQGGMSPSAQSPNVMLFTDPKSGEQHGYYDGWASDGVFEYTGEGQHGDQQMTAGNKSLLNHRKAGRNVRLFTGTGGPIVYEGEFEVDPVQPFVERSVHSTGGGPDRRVFVFRLRPVAPSPPTTGATDGATSVPIAQQNVETWTASAVPATRASAVEAELVRRYQRFLESKGDTVVRRRYVTPDGYLFNDVFNESRNQLIEAKGTSGRSDVRMAIGQLLDYSKKETTSPSLGVLLPQLPSLDVVDLLEDLKIAVIRPDGRRFSDTAGGSFT